MSALQVHQVQPAPRQTAAWLQRLLLPACRLARLDPPFPVELRPTGRWNGFATARDLAPDLRVSITTQICMMTPRGIARLYLHEAAHQLLEEANPEALHSHDAAFYALNYLLLLRLDAASDDAQLPGGLRSWVSDMSLYDLGNAPAPLADQAFADWLPKALAWALAQAHELALTELDARACAREISARYLAWCAQLLNFTES